MTGLTDVTLRPETLVRYRSVHLVALWARQGFTALDRGAGNASTQRGSALFGHRPESIGMIGRDLS